MSGERGKTVEAGKLPREIAAFSAARRRTATAVCATAVELAVIDAEKAIALARQEPRFGLHLVRLITDRLGAA